MPFRTQQLMRTLAMALAWLALLMVGFGVTRSVVVCNQPCCAGHVKLAPSCDRMDAVRDCAPKAQARKPACSCCARRHADAPHTPNDGTPHHAGDGACHGCHHVPLGVDLAPPPFAAALAALDPAHDHVAFAAPWHAAETTDAAHPPATGPPRCDQRTRLLATTVLRL